MKPKYSIIIPVHNGMPYIKTCIQSIIEQNYENYELIISNDHSTDGSAEYLRAIAQGNIKYFEPIGRLSMAEHWEWASKHASGEWQIFVGQDDALQSYFFDLADKLTSEATSLGIRLVASRRAYFFWPGCHEVYKQRINFCASNRINVKSILFSSVLSMFFMPYFELPQMYCSSLFHRSLIDQARSLQNGRIFTCHPQDANLAAIGCALNKTYLSSDIPLGWIGTSSKSAGLAITTAGRPNGLQISKDTEALRREYANSIINSSLEYNKLAGDFNFADPCVYFWQSLLSVEALLPNNINKFIRSNFFKYNFFAIVWMRLLFDSSKKVRLPLLANIISANSISFLGVKSVAILISSPALLFYLFAYFFPRALMRMYRAFFGIYYVEQINSDHESTLSNTNPKICALVKSRAWI